MKKIILILICFLAFPVFAWELDGETFQIEQNGIVYTVTFHQGPFSPGESGTAILEDDNGMEVFYSYRYYNDVGELNGLPMFFRENKLLIFDKEPLELKKVEKK